MGLHDVVVTVKEVERFCSVLTMYIRSPKRKAISQLFKHAISAVFIANLPPL